MAVALETCGFWEVEVGFRVSCQVEKNVAQIPLLKMFLIKYSFEVFGHPPNVKQMGGSHYAYCIKMIPPAS